MQKCWSLFRFSTPGISLGKDTFISSVFLGTKSKSHWKVFDKTQAIWKIFRQKITCAKNVMESITNEVLNVLIIYGAHNQGGNAYGGIYHRGTNFTPRRQDGVGNFSPCARSFEHTSYKCYEGNRVEAENDEDDKAILTSYSFSPSILEYILDYRRRKGVGFNTWSELKGALSDKFGVGQFERLEWTRNVHFSQGIVKEESIKLSLLEKASMINELLQARIEISKSVELHVEGEMSKEYFGVFMSDMSFEEQESIEIERKDRVEEKERLLEKSKMSEENKRIQKKSWISVVLDPSCYGFGNLDDTSLVELNIVGFVFEFDRNSLQHVFTIISIRGRRNTMEFEGQGESVGGKLILCYGDLTMRYDDT
ncbi:hypothetical protein M9H77_16514 [Catharanthus roseus]|uniref:Uncharacterized protein n=1 Tax=Catharanthus roseus TaxID=4058 RepID=A0ACC0B1Y9_CATRO|nr:hypothetical protein M9H77_16514 [Catharanthus roseus]